MEPLDPLVFGEEQPCFGCAPHHPIGFRLRFSRDDDSVVTSFTPGPQYQGPPGVMHGGLVTTLADEIAAWTVLGLAGKFGFTAKLSAKLKKPVKIGLAIEARGRTTRVTSRIVDVHVTMRQDLEGTGNPIEVFQGDFTFAVLDRAAAEKLLGGSLSESWAKLAR